MFQAMTHLEFSPLCKHIVMPATKDFTLSDVTNQAFVSFIQQVRNFCTNNMVEFYDERINMKGSVTVHWDGKFRTTES
jgi:abortive infection bacteriophage resistance protein